MSVNNQDLVNTEDDFEVNVFGWFMHWSCLARLPNCVRFRCMLCTEFYIVAILSFRIVCTCVNAFFHSLSLCPFTSHAYIQCALVFVCLSLTLGLPNIVEN